MRKPCAKNAWEHAYVNCKRRCAKHNYLITKTIGGKGRLTNEAINEIQQTVWVVY